MVVSTVLCRTRLAADFYTGNVGFTASPGQYGPPHPLHHRFVMPGFHLRVPPPGVKRVYLLVLYLFHHVRRDKVSPVGYCRTEIGDLQRCGVHFALSDGNTDYGQPVP